MNNLSLMRKIYTDNSTIGDLYFNGEFMCNTIEDSCRRRDKNNDGKLQASEKVYGQTAIPSGHYEIKMEFSNHFQRKMPFLQNVPLFEGIMIHWGNSPKDVLGCIATGSAVKDTPDWVSSSQKAYNDLEPKIVKALSEGPLFITIVGGYSA